MIQAHTDHAGLTVHFDHPALNFTIICCDENPLKVFPSLINQNSSQPEGTTSYSTIPTTICLLTSMPPPSQPREHVTLHCGFHVVSFCLLLATSLVGTSLLATPMWLEGQEICPGVQVISGPIDLNTVPSSCSLDTPQGSGILVSQNLTSFSEMPILCETFYTTVVIQSTKDKVSLPFNANLDFIQPKTPENEQVFHDAANQTADQLTSTWLYFAESVTTNDSCFSSQQEHCDDSCFYSMEVGSNQDSLYGSPARASSHHSSLSWQLHAQTAEMARAGLDSSILSPFLPEPDLDHPEALPPTGQVYLDPYSDEYFDKLVAALELDSPMYANIDSEVIAKFKEILRKYPEAFHLPRTPLGTINILFYHNIDTGDSPPVYQLPYRKSPAELCAIKNELQRMLSFNIIKPSHSPNGSLCILVCKPLEKGKPQPPRFFVDYRHLNTVTIGMVIPFQVYPIYLMLLVGKVICKA